MIIAERLSARHVIAEYCVEIVCLYIYIYVRLRNAISPYGEAHTVVLYARPTRAAIASPRDCTFFHNYWTFFHNSTTKWRDLAREGKPRQLEIEERHHCYSVTAYRHDPALYTFTLHYK